MTTFDDATEGLQIFGTGWSDSSGWSGSMDIREDGKWDWEVSYGGISEGGVAKDAYQARARQDATVRRITRRIGADPPVHLR